MLKFTKEEKQKIKTELNEALDEIEELWQKSEAKTIRATVNIANEKSSYWVIEIDDEGIRLVSWDNTTIHLQKKNKLGIFERPIDYDMASQLLKRFKDTKDRIEFQIKYAASQKRDSFQFIDRVESLYGKSNKKDDEVEKENSSDKRKVINIDFGKRIVNLIVDRDVVLVKKKYDDFFFDEDILHLYK